MDYVKELIDFYPSLSVCESDIKAACGMMIDCFSSGGKLLCCGNGGSSADCDHFVGELMKGFLLERPLNAEEISQFDSDYVPKRLQKGLPAVSLSSQTALMTAYINDCCAETVFAQQVYALAKEGDILVAFSTSGSSENVIYALEAAKASGIKSVAVTGLSGGKCAEKADVCIKIPQSETRRVQELTLPVYHCLAAQVEQHFFGK